MAPSSMNSLSSLLEPPAIPESPSVTLSPVILTLLNLNNEKGSNPANRLVRTTSQAASAKFAEQLALMMTSKWKQPLAPLKPPPKSMHAEDPPYVRGDTEEVESLIQDHSVLSYYLNNADAPKHIKVMHEPLSVSIAKSYNSWMQVLGVEDPLKFIEHPSGPPEKTRGYFSAEMLLKM
ncbi:hypothetical protein C8J56DRAFT_1053500 [Mycena floridula]|nr:hypothetical protein C8J56DRAFT_1053500 [Mycena floridula]